MYPKFYLYKRIKDAKILIDRYYAEPINLNKISEQVHLSKYYFLRLFKEAYGTSPYQYLIHKRIAVAKQKLASGSTVAETCHSVGFESLPSFSSLFKRRVGISPSAYRNNRQIENSNFE
ncbi:MAG: AraC family transcriptional regulator [Cyclobacteriaceae bacterium]